MWGLVVIVAAVGMVVMAATVGMAVMVATVATVGTTTAGMVEECHTEHGVSRRMRSMPRIRYLGRG